MGLLESIRAWWVARRAAKLKAAEEGHEATPAEPVLASPPAAAPAPEMADVAQAAKEAPPPSQPVKTVVPEGAELPAEIRAGAALLAAFLKGTGVGFPVALAVELIGGVLGGVAEDNWWLDHGQAMAEQAVAAILAAAQQAGGDAQRTEVAAEIDRRQLALYRKIWAMSDPVWEALNGGHGTYLRLQAAKAGLTGRIGDDGLWTYVSRLTGESVTYEGDPASELYDGKRLTAAEKEALAQYRANLKAAQEAQAAKLEELPAAAIKVQLAEEAKGGRLPPAAKPATVPRDELPGAPHVVDAAPHDVAEAVKQTPVTPAPALPAVPKPAPLPVPSMPVVSALPIDRVAVAREAAKRLVDEGASIAAPKRRPAIQ